MKIENEKATGVKIAYIGGGSRGWAWKLMSDLVTCEDMSGDVYLYDIDYEAAKEAYTDEPYKSHAEFQDAIFKFMFTYGYVEVEYALGSSV